MSLPSIQVIVIPSSVPQDTEDIAVKEDQQGKWNASHQSQYSTNNLSANEGKLTIMGLMIVYTIIFATCDLFFAYSENSDCVLQSPRKGSKAKALIITLQSFLYISGMYSLFILIFSIIIYREILRFNKEQLCSLEVLNKMFKISWFVVGFIIYFYNTADLKCTLPFNLYLFWSLFIKTFTVCFPDIAYLADKETHETQVIKSDIMNNV